MKALVTGNTGMVSCLMKLMFISNLNDCTVNLGNLNEKTVLKLGDNA